MDPSRATEAVGNLTGLMTVHQSFLEMGRADR